MDLLTRKKLLLRKYNNNIFSQQQLDFFNKINATQIIILLKQNPHLQQCAIFFQHTSIRQVQKIIASIFQPQQSFVRSQMFNVLVNILRNSIMLLEICFKNDDFNYMSLFGFLQEENVDYPILILLEDVLLPFIRKFPCQVIDVIANDECVEEIMLKRIYQKPIFKIMYTVVFCLSKRHSDIYKDHVKKIICELLQTPFTYLLHKDNKIIHEQISIFALDKTELKYQQKTRIENNSKNIPPIHTKRVREKKSKETSVSSQELKSSYQPKLTKQPSLGSNYKSHTISQSEQSTGSPMYIRHQLQLQINELQQFSHEQLPTIISNDSLKNIILNENLDYSDLTFNMKDLLSDIAFNLKSVDWANVLILLNNINETYINGLLFNCKRFIVNDEYQGYCQGSICIVMEFGELYKAAVKLLEIYQDNSIGGQISVNSETDVTLIILVAKLQKQLKIIASKIPSLCSCILENNEMNAFYSSGQKLKKIGMTKFKMLELIHQLLQFNSKTNQNTFQSLHLQINFSHFDLFLIFHKYLTSLKWNNLVHCLLVKLAKLYLEQDYSNFKKRYIQHFQKPKDGILGTLMQIFRNKKFVFLKNMKFTNNGNLHAVYEITKQIVQKVKQNGDYQVLIQKFPAFDAFVCQDLQNYQKTIQASHLEVQQELIYLGNLLRPSAQKQEMIQKPCKISLVNTEQMMNEIQTAKRWLPGSSLKSIQCKQFI